ncbi:hypothetical protein [Xanthomonas albilineans]|uniref:hypothetical protein n=1 Tax=Xanthomonas albilineans TaxID=29447 RepID=UPI001269FEF1|nr:hypothetical protein [Xanthomonas albilineans]
MLLASAITGTVVVNVDPLGLASHYYQVKSFICSESQVLCNPENVFTRLRQYPAPFSGPSHIINPCDTTKIPVLGTVVHGVDSSKNTITNTTLPDHRLYPGQVTRSVVEENGNIYVETTGTGEGDWAWANSVLADPLWGQVDQNIAAPWAPTVYNSEYAPWVQ